VGFNSAPASAALRLKGTGKNAAYDVLDEGFLDEAETKKLVFHL
jgi:hypothetical protein